ncbi:UNVERIFIED_CONTAM: hypothetical protein K2H54_018173 [Gekko kuhli]
MGNVWDEEARKALSNGTQGQELGIGEIDTVPARFVKNPIYPSTARQDARGEILLARLKKAGEAETL